jgi:hypothetical protein
MTNSLDVLDSKMRHLRDLIESTAGYVPESLYRKLVAAEHETQVVVQHCHDQHRQMKSYLEHHVVE